MRLAIDSRRRARRGWVRTVLPLAIGAGCLWLLAGRLSTFDPLLMWQSFRSVTPAEWILSGLFTLLSFWALGRYDAVIHRHLRTGVSERDAQLSGMSSIALAQVLGLGVVTGALARWRLLPVLGPVRAAQVTAAVSASFLLAWAIITAIACLLLARNLLPGWLALCGLILAVALSALSLLLPEIRFSRWKFRLPSLQAICAIGFFALIDTVAAAVVLYILLPAGISFLSLLPAFLIALGAGLFAGTPGGVGPFELMMLALLPVLPESEMMGGILAFRLIYYAVPALLAAFHVMRFRSVSDAGERHHVPRAVPELLIDHAPRSECGIARQNGARLLGCARTGGIVVSTPQSLTMLFDPLAGDLKALLPGLTSAARGSNRIPLVYKCTSRQAVQARSSGWQVARVADEAVIAPGTFSLDGPCHRQLRRKLRQASKAGVTVSSPQDLPLACMAGLDAAWKKTHGLARGLSTGRFAPSYVAHQRVYCAWAGGKLIAFATFHCNHHEMCLDLMRHGPGLPDGTMHLLICSAIDDARQDGIPLSLAAMPAIVSGEHRFLSHIRSHIARRSGGDGLTRFKESFAPRRVPLYMAAPSRASLILGAIDLALAMRRPAETADPLSTGLEDAYDGRGITPVAPT